MIYYCQVVVCVIMRGQIISLLTPLVFDTLNMRGISMNRVDICRGGSERKGDPSSISPTPSVCACADKPLPLSGLLVIALYTNHNIDC